MRPITVLDPGHGGTVGIGRSTPFGVRGPNGQLEKNLTLALAQRTAARLGTSVRLTRNGDVNLSLGDRARVSRDLGAPAFVSIHAGGEAYGGCGCEAWVHSHAGPESMALADDVRGELARLGISDRGAHRGDLAVLTPSLHPPGCGACMVEVDNLDLDHRRGDPRQLDAVADGLAHALERVMTGSGRSRHRTYSFGRGAAHVLDQDLVLTDFPTNVFVIVPDTSTPAVPREIRQSDHDRLQRAWDCMMHDRGLIQEGTEPNKRAWRELLRGGLADSPLIRDVFMEQACDVDHPLTVHLRRSFPTVIMDALQFDPTQPDGSRNGHHDHHTFDLNDMDHLPRVSGNPRNFMILQHEVLIHGLREARQGALGDSGPVAHDRGHDAEDAFRQEQGQIATRSRGAPTATPIAGAPAEFDVRTDLLDASGAVAMFETWRIVRADAVVQPDGTGGPDLQSISYSP